MKSILTFEEAADLDSWQTVDDVVMGGRSHSRVRWVGDSEPHRLRFEGEVSLENNGGFCSVRNQGRWDLSRFDELLWTLRGTKRPFMATLRCAGIPDGASFRHRLEPEPDVWEDYRLQLDDFRLFRRGNQLSEQARVDPGQITSFGFLLADKSRGPFVLELAKISARAHQENSQ